MGPPHPMNFCFATNEVGTDRPAPTRFLPCYLLKVSKRQFPKLEFPLFSLAPPPPATPPLAGSAWASVRFLALSSPRPCWSAQCFSAFFSIYLIWSLSFPCSFSSLSFSDFFLVYIYMLMHIRVYIYIYSCVSRLTPNFAWERVRDKVAPLPIYERVQKILSLWRPTQRRSYDGLGFLSLRRASVGPPLSPRFESKK